MEPKKVGIIALVVVALGLLAFSFRSTFMGGPRVVSQQEGEAIGRQMQENYRRMEQQGRGGNSGGGAGMPAGAGVPGGPGGPPGGMNGPPR